MPAIPLTRIEGKYEILEKLREGGMGAIYKVRHRLLDEIRVIKLMRPQLVEDQELKIRFLREARLAIKLRHPNIAQLYDFTIDDDGTAFIVMEFIDGMTLEDALAFHGPPPLGLSLEIAQQSLRALGYLHMKGFVHRDISPDNLMLTEDPDGQPLVKLIDLGIAKTLETGGENQLTQTGAFVGKLRYASPEQFGADGATKVDHRGDLYSFGIVLYELLTGRFPIQGRDASSMIAGHLFRSPLDFAEADPGGKVPADLRAVVLKALAKNPGDRFASAAELSRELAAFRLPSEVSEEALRSFLSRPFELAEVSSPLDSGSTQSRLDQHFELAATPSPGSLLELAKTAIPTPVSSRLASDEKVMGESVGTIELTRRSREDERELAAALAAIRAALESRSYRSAESLLYAAEANFGGREEFAPFYEQVARQRREDLEARVGEHLDRARQLAATGNLPDALTEIERARRLQPESSAAAAAMAEIEAGRKRREEVALLLTVARELAAREDFKGALKELRRAARLAPEDLEVRTLKEEVEATSHQRADTKRRDQQRARDLKKIEERLSKGNLETARELLEKATATHGEEALEALQERLDGLRRKERRAQAMATAVAEIRARLDGDELDAAGGLLDQAVVRFGAAEPLREQWERLEEKRRAAKARAGALQVHLAEARRLAAEERIDAALVELGRAAELEPANPAILALKKEIGTARRRQKEAQRQAAELVLAVAAVEVHLDHGRLREAAGLMDKALAEFGDQPPLPRLRTRLEGLRRQAQTRHAKLSVAAPAPAVSDPVPAEPTARLDDLKEANQGIADLLSRGEGQQALKELQSALLRFGDRPEFHELRKRIAAMLLDD